MCARLFRWESRDGYICFVLKFLVVDNVVYMGTVTNSNKTWHVLICVVSNKKSISNLETLQFTLGVVLHHSTIKPWRPCSSHLV